MLVRVFMHLFAIASALAAETWESVNLDIAVRGSRVLELTEASLEAATQEHPLLVVWFYAPWCKQCKLLRDSYEEAASTGVAGVEFGRIDCVKYPAVKEAFQVFSYPALKVLRGPRSRWLYIPQARTAQMIVAAVAAEAAGAYRLLDDVATLRSAIFDQLAEKGGEAGANEAATRKKELQLLAGVGEAAVVALLSHSNGGAATTYATLAAGCDIKLSPMPFLATTRQEVLHQLDIDGIEALVLDHLAVLQFNQSADERWSVSTTAPLAFDIPTLDALVLGHRLPSVVDFSADFMWPKRAAALSHVLLHGLFFAGAEHAHLLPVLREAAAPFVRGSMIFFQMDVDDPHMKGMMKKYGVGSRADCPRLVFLDQRRKGDGVNRQLPYTGELSVGKLLEFLDTQGLPRGAPKLSEPGSKDEL
jgi:thiol-disulfide isomerase/thioredoxin